MGSLLFFFSVRVDFEYAQGARGEAAKNLSSLLSLICTILLYRSPPILIPVGEDGHLPFQGVDSKMNQV